MDTGIIGGVLKMDTFKVFVPCSLQLAPTYH